MFPPCPPVPQMAFHERSAHWNYCILYPVIEPLMLSIELQTALLIPLPPSQSEVLRVLDRNSWIPANPTWEGLGDTKLTLCRLLSWASDLRFESKVITMKRPWDDIRKMLGDGAVIMEVELKGNLWILVLRRQGGREGEIETAAASDDDDDDDDEEVISMGEVGRVVGLWSSFRCAWGTD